MEIRVVNKDGQVVWSREIDPKKGEWYNAEGGRVWVFGHTSDGRNEQKDMCNTQKGDMIEVEDETGEVTTEDPHHDSYC